MSLANFDSRKNYLKQYDAQWVRMDKPNLTDSYLSKYYSTYTVTHNLGYLPLVRAWYDPDNSGSRFPLNGQQYADVSNFYSVPGLGNFADFQFFVSEITETTVTFRAERYTADGTLSGTFPFFYKIYADPSLGEF